MTKRASIVGDSKPAASGPAGKHRSRLSAAVDRLGRDIVSGRYPIGSVLPVEAKLCEALGVGRNTLREAVKVVSDKGMLKTARRYGTRVLDRQLWNILDVSVLMWLTEDPEYALELRGDLTDIRAVIEPIAAQRAAERGPPQLGEQMLKAAERLSGSDLEAVFAADLQFHATLYDGTGSLLLSRLGKLIVAMMEATFRHGGFTVYEPNTDQHVRIAEAISAGDVTRAGRETVELLAVNVRDESTARKAHGVTRRGQNAAPKARRDTASSG